MESQDYFIKMLERMMIALGQTLAKLKLYNKQGSFDLVIYTVKQNFSEDLNIDFDSFINLNNEETINLLIAKSVKSQQIEVVSNILFVLSDSVVNSDLKQVYLTKAKVLIEWAIKNDKSYSTERANLLSQINNAIVG